MSSNEVSCRLLLIRHGQTEWNRQYRFQGRENVPLTEEGKRQAHNLALRMKNNPPETVYSSPLDRALYTACEIASYCGKKPVIMPELEEINFGEWEGKSIASIESENPDAFNRWRTDPFFNPPEGGEAWPEISSRLKRAFDVMISSGCKDIAAVTHGGVMRAMYAVIFGLDPHHTWYMDVANCGVSGIEIVGGRCYLSFMNDSHHLNGGAGITLPFWR